MNTFPTYTVDIDNCDWSGLSLVLDPAIESNLQYFQHTPQYFSIQDEAQHIVFGPCLRVDYPILRQAPDGSFYNIVFSREVAQKMVSQFLSSDLSLNLSHLPIFPEGIEPLSFFIKDSSKGISPIGYDDVADGSIFCSYHISNPLVWQSVVDGTFRGFSIECSYERNLIQDMSFSSLFSRIKSAFAELNVIRAIPNDLFLEGPLEVGTKCFIDEVTVAPDATYVTISDTPQDIVIADGIIASISDHVEVPAEAPTEPAEPADMEEVAEVPAEPVEPIEEPAPAEPAPAVDPLIAINEAINALSARITAIESRLTDLEGQPEGALPQDQFKNIKSISSGIAAVKAMRSANRVR